MNVTIHHRGESVTVPFEQYQQATDALVAKLGAWEPGVSRVDVPKVTAPVAESEPVPATSVKGKGFSSFGSGGQIIDPEAKARIERVNAELTKGGLATAVNHQVYATGTRMADVGYANQKARKAEFDSLRPLTDEAHAFVARINAEQRREIVTTAAQFAKSVTINGGLKYEGLQLREQAIRGLLGRLESPATRYVFGLRDRIVDVDEEATAEQKQADREALLDVVQRECRRFPDVELRLRAREGLGDIFATVSPTYGEADAPSVLPTVLLQFPEGAKGTISYDPESTVWEVRANIFTPTKVDEQAVGEPFQGFASVKGRDDGTGRLIGGGGFIIIVCLNAGTYESNQAISSRAHRGRILQNLDRLVFEATKAIRILTKAWGIAREEVIPQPSDEKGKLIPVEQAIPGFYRHALTARRGELVGVLPGRTEKHVKALALNFNEQRRNREQITRADLANGLTRYIQTQPQPVQRGAEAAVGRWVVEREKVLYLPEA